METSSGEHNAFINLNRKYMYTYKEKSYPGSKLLLFQREINIAVLG